MSRRKKEKEKEEPVPDENDPEAIFPLSAVTTRLTNLGRTVDGQGWAYRSLECVKKRVGPIKGIEAYTNLQHINLSENQITDVALLKGLPYILTLNLSNNSITTLRPVVEVEEPPFIYLRNLNLSFNNIMACPPIPFVELRTLNLANNGMTVTKDFTGHEKLQTLILADNKITSLEGLGNMPSLTSFDISGNELTTCAGLGALPELKDLNLSKMKLEELELPFEELPNLASLDVSGPEQKLSFKTLEDLRKLPKLRKLHVSGSPFTAPPDNVAKQPGKAEEFITNLRAHLLILHWRLTDIDGEPVQEAEIEKAKELNIQRLLDEREQRKKAEEDDTGDGG